MSVAPDEPPARQPWEIPSEYNEPPPPEPDEGEDDDLDDLEFDDEDDYGSESDEE